MNSSSSYLFWLLCALTACGRGPAPGPPERELDIPSVTVLPLMEVHVVDLGAGVPDADVFVHDDTGLLRGRQTTDASGVAIVPRWPGGSVTAAFYDVSAGSYDFYTRAGLTNETTLMLGIDAQPEATLDVTLPGNVAGATSYMANSGCHSITLPDSVARELSVRPSCKSADGSGYVLAVARDPNDEVIAHAFASGLPVNDGVVTPVMLTAWDPAVDTFTYDITGVTNLPGETIDVDVQAGIDDALFLLQLEIGVPTTGDVAASHTLPAGARPRVTMYARHQESTRALSRSLESATLSIDVSELLPVVYVSDLATDESGLPAETRLTINGDLRGADLLTAQLMWQNPDGSPGRWLLHAPVDNTESVPWPVIPPEARDALQSTVSYLSIVDVRDWSFLSGFDDWKHWNGEIAKEHTFRYSKGHD